MSSAASSVTESFRGPVLRGLAWKTATRALFEISKLVVGVTLARLLTPVEYGVAGMVLVLVAFEPVPRRCSGRGRLRQRRPRHSQPRDCAQLKKFHPTMGNHASAPKQDPTGRRCD